MKIAKSCTEEHFELMDMLFGKTTPSRDGIDDFALRTEQNINPSDVTTMRNMACTDFMESIRQELHRKHGDGAQAANGNKKAGVFDIFELKPALNRPQKVLAVLLPIRKAPNHWYDANGDFWAPNKVVKGRFLGNLVGTARILQNLGFEKPQQIPPLMQHAMKRTKVVDVRSTPRKIVQSVRYSDSMNKSQRQAVAALLDPSFQKGFLALQGPPGCGKTTTLVSMIRNLDGGVIVCAPSNAAVANIALKLIDANAGFDVTNTIVFGGANCLDSVRFLNPKLRGQDLKTKQRLRSKTKSETKKEQLRIKFCKWMGLPETTSMSRLQGLCPRHFFDEFGNPQIDIRHLNRLIGRAQVVFCTLNSSAAKPLRDNVEFKTLLLDEAGQCAEAEFYLATTFPSVQRIVVLGDPQQLPATVIDQQCEAAGYGVSWLKRIYDMHRSKVHLLNTQYRMDPLILEFPNREFYENRIQSGNNVVDRRDDFRIDAPLRFIDMKGRGMEQKYDSSWKNEGEATAIAHLLREDLDISRLCQYFRNHQKEPRILVITPYRGQVTVLRRRLDSVVEVATVDSFQGQEADVVVVSTVRTKNLGFTDNGPRLNVALTRAKCILRVVGEKQFFLRMRTSILRKLTLHAAAYDAPAPPTVPPPVTTPVVTPPTTTTSVIAPPPTTTFALRRDHKTKRDHALDRRSTIGVRRSVMAPPATNSSVIAPPATNSSVIAPPATNRSVIAPPPATNRSVIAPPPTTTSAFRRDHTTKRDHALDRRSTFGVRHSVMAPPATTSSVIAPPATKSPVIAPAATKSSVIAPHVTASDDIVPVASQDQVEKSSVFQPESYRQNQEELSVREGKLDKGAENTCETVSVQDGVAQGPTHQVHTAKQQVLAILSKDPGDKPCTVS